MAVPIDQWGHVPFPPDPMRRKLSPRSSTRISPTNRLRKARRPDHGRIDDESQQGLTKAPVVEPVLVNHDPRYYERGV
ncbi:hypothetical protein HQ346_04725 [Rhodococcus sp. BP-252]|uniref:hypothetical protein n=1 Tax=unclassified Rhodococcus (in: high G+C Gram-positive bacteria) TaxID=192944 RepID=UPI001C9ADA6C|nr:MULTISPECIES: hypothetical protein [unclassified Rhodococcus (in: high G+C Gram-positive bacteria)]MBY6449071.1 hypothetical protein [Rhodococcus sp. BP-315]MBY6468715.1 hypothetical protein [Rhodococcus sp. BP-313]MBY6474154.1 hypothetical protein [Rhodococcus sp. BP-261]MBY6517916.1 hypothetical protein [Rhodococcus sp. BP-250]MBY6580265.1 hypothetical protein [Rhodococcus sp. BP-257]